MIPQRAMPACVALITLFDQDGRLLVERTAELAAALVDDGADGILVAGSSGEFWVLDDTERVQLVAAIRTAAPAGIPVLAHVGGTKGERLTTLIKASIDAGADAVLALPVGIDYLPAYYTAVVAAAGCTPALAYHLPTLGTPVPVGLLAELGVAGIKDSSGDAARFATEVLHLDVATYTGSPGLLNLGRQLGAAGAITGVANLRPSWCAAAWQGDDEAQREICRLYLATGTPFPGGLKAAAKDRWGIPSYQRPGLAPRPLCAT